MDALVSVDVNGAKITWLVIYIFIPTPTSYGSLTQEIVCYFARMSIIPHLYDTCD